MILKKYFEVEKVPSIDVECLEAEDSRNLPRDLSLPPDLPVSRRGVRVDPDTGSLRSVHSENSFQTCSSEPQLNLVPRQVSDTYEEQATPPERKASTRALRQHQQLIQQHLHSVPNSNEAKTAKSPRWPIQWFFYLVSHKNFFYSYKKAKYVQISHVFLLDDWG